jgi:hypothetical protein
LFYLIVQKGFISTSTLFVSSHRSLARDEWLIPEKPNGLSAQMTSDFCPHSPKETRKGRLAKSGTIAIE